MTLIVETGTGSGSAESYASIADADAYQTARGNTLWTGLLELEKEQALRRATAFMSQIYRMRWAGYRMSEVQALDWPRAYVPIPDVVGIYRGTSFVANNSVPIVVKNACIELAYEAAGGDLNPPATQGVVSKEVGPIKVVYDKDSPPGKRFPAVDAMLAPYLSYGSNTMKLVRM
ncbi:hypothetical protein UFOVP1254_105 [uncultured Caudovirales phage]|uniref:Putative DnaT-like domain-containing protein n=1 Tax=uncultured Caudovirales phage TaxID=2100421 RepID=A0A6J5RBZ4_9CAUD|nr:hypothetical protein UFOVP1254_105 [uncultured Caudovirales phage]